MRPEPVPSGVARRTKPTRRKPTIPRVPAGARQRALETVERLAAVYPAACELDHRNAFELTIATILSAQTTDQTVNRVSPELFRRYPDARALAEADPLEIEALIKPTGFFHNKTVSILACANQLVERFGGAIPPRMDDLVTLPGIGRKTANVILGVSFGIPGFAVDTHVTRLSRRLRIASSADPVKIEAQVTRLVPDVEWTGLSLRLILHGRRVCDAKRPRCEDCVLNDFCPSSTVRPRTRPASPP